MTIDFHVHAFPDCIAESAVDKLSSGGGGLNPVFDGTIARLREELRRAHVRGVMLPVATNPHKLAHMNEWAVSQNFGEIISFGAMHPFAPDAYEQLEYIADSGLKGVKLHPEFQNFDVDDPKAIELYRRISRLGLITVFHSGLDVGYMPPERCAPRKLASVLSKFDGAPVVAAHMGGYMRWEEVLECLCGRDVYLDTSYCAGRIVKPLAERIVEKHGTDRILFGSDMPWLSIDDSRRLIESLGLSDEENKRVFELNAKRLLGEL